jgi:hypothetical protein
MAVSTTFDISDEEMKEVVDMCRMILRDFIPNNVLLDDVQFPDREIRGALRLTMSDYNAMPPITSVHWRDLPEGLLITGICRWLMLSESFLQARNQISVQTDGLGVVGLDDKYQLYASQAAQLKNDFMMQARELKTSRNLESGYGTMSSGYANVSRFQHS